MLDVLHITDVHLLPDAGARLVNVDTQRCLEAVLDQALADGRPDALVATGDIAQEGRADVYARFLDTVRSRYDGPLLCTPGNHDLLAPMRDAGLPMQDLEFDHWRIVALDSHADESLASVVPAEKLAELSARVGDRRTLLVTHHHLLPVQCPWLDGDRIAGADVHAWLAASTAVRAVVFGHVHQIVEARLGNVRLMGSPSTCFQFLPRSARFTLDTLPPGFRRIRLYDDGSIVSAVIRGRPFSDPPAIQSDHT
ncbi:MAG: metallophosphoesterase [Pseudomonadales bacterium]|nr:metallophosphoesterase [Pseudomonadales bacterium]MCP5183322.1 metallophosphoesterase [Pseudomonadales bacterium]